MRDGVVLATVADLLETKQHHLKGVKWVIAVVRQLSGVLLGAQRDAEGRQ